VTAAGAATRALRDPLDEALARCYRHLGEREQTTAQLRSRLNHAGVAADVIEAALAIVTEQGYLNDARYARLLVERRRGEDGWGAGRIRAQLSAAGVDRDLIDGVLAEHSGYAVELATAQALLRRRCPGGLNDDRGRRRAFGILARLGYEAEVAYDAIRAARGPSGAEPDDL
jgi:regulatory protein